VWNAMPYFFHEDYRPSDHNTIERVYAENLGFNFRPTPSLVLKVQGAYVNFPGNQGLLNNVHLWTFSSQASWVF
jgi:hypothetical protein